MSIIRCEICSRFIDSDDDPECFVEILDYDDNGFAKAITGKWTQVVCEPCREHDRQTQERERERLEMEGQ